MLSFTTGFRSGRSPRTNLSVFVSWWYLFLPAHDVVVFRRAHASVKHAGLRIDQDHLDGAGSRDLLLIGLLPRRYLQLFSKDAVYRHVRSSAGLDPDAVVAWIERGESAWDLTDIVCSSNDTSEKHRPRGSRGSLTSANRRSSNVRSDASDIDTTTGTHMAD